MNPLCSQRPVRTAGACPTVIGLHAGAGTPDEWRPLVERLRFRTRVLAPHLRGYAASRASGTGEPLSLEDEAAPIAPLLGHIDPGSHPEEVDREIEDFFARHARVWYRDPEPTAFHALPVFAGHSGPDGANTVSREEPRALPGTPLRAPWSCAWRGARG